MFSLRQLSTTIFFPFHRNIPDKYKILFLQGGGSGQFSGVPLNIMRDGCADYLVTGTWSAKAVKEGAKYGKVKEAYSKPEKYTSKCLAWIMAPTK